VARRLGSAAALAAVLGVLGLGEAQDAQRTLRDGVFSPAQVMRGDRLFNSICTDCHEITEFTGAGAYLEEVEGEPVWETFEFVSAEMPEDDPGSLNPQDYAAVLAYIFSVYGLPSGDAALAVDEETLEAITIVRPAPPGS
jgi:mono/diheme cytochrome c family protein